MVGRFVANNEPPDISIRFPGLDKLARIKMGPGVMGRTSVMVMGVLVFGLGAMWVVNEVLWAALGVFAVTVGVVLYLVSRAFAHADKFPDHALLEDAQLVRMAEIKQAAKDAKIIDADARPVPNDEPPAQIASDGEG